MLRARFPERPMGQVLIVLGLLLACAINAACLYSHL
jgi:hypothetical protein